MCPVLLDNSDNIFKDLQMEVLRLLQFTQLET